MVRRSCRAAHDAARVRMRLSSKPDHRMMWGRGTWEGTLTWLLGNWSELHVKMIFKAAIQQQCQTDKTDWTNNSGSFFTVSVLKCKVRFSKFILNVKKCVKIGFKQNSFGAQTLSTLNCSLIVFLLFLFFFDRFCSWSAAQLRCYTSFCYFSSVNTLHVCNLGRLGDSSSVCRDLAWEPEGRQSKSSSSQCGVWTGSWRGASSPPGHYRGAPEQGTEPLTALV